MNMKILFIEADKYLDNHQEDFAEKLQKDGHKIAIHTDCYNNIEYLKGALINYCPDAIFVQTTFVYTDKIKLLIPLVEFIDYPVELWYAGNYSATRIIQMLPEDKQSLFTGYDIWMLEYGNELLADCWKRPAGITI